MLSLEHSVVTASFRPHERANLPLGLIGLVCAATLLATAAAAAAADGPDLVVDFLPATFVPRPCERFALFAVVKNISNRSAGPFRVTAYLTGAAPWAVPCIDGLGERVPGLAAGGVLTIRLPSFEEGSVSYEGPGSFEQSVVADTCNEVTETNEYNNRQVRTVQVTNAEDGPDLVIQSITPSVPNPLPDQPFDLELIVSNIGNRASANCKVGIKAWHSELIDDPCTASRMVDIPPLLPGESTAGRFLGIRVGETPDRHFRVSGWGDHCDAVREINECNNRHDKWLQFADNLAPDLIIENIAAESIDSPVGPHEPRAAVQITIKNAGASASAACHILIYRDRASEPGEVCVGDYALPVEGLAAAESTTLALTLGYPRGEHIMWAWVDGCREVPESDEGNNKASHSLHVGCRGCGNQSPPELPEAPDNESESPPPSGPCGASLGMPFLAMIGAIAGSGRCHRGSGR